MMGLQDFCVAQTGGEGGNTAVVEKVSAEIILQLKLFCMYEQRSNCKFKHCYPFLITWVLALALLQKKKNQYSGLVAPFISKPIS